jgi:hypothetical protein
MWNDIVRSHMNADSLTDARSDSAEKVVLWIGDDFLPQTAEEVVQWTMRCLCRTMVSDTFR